MPIRHNIIVALVATLSIIGVDTSINAQDREFDLIESAFDYGYSTVIDQRGGSIVRGVESDSILLAGSRTTNRLTPIPAVPVAAHGSSCCGSQHCESCESDHSSCCERGVCRHNDCCETHHSVSCFVPLGASLNSFIHQQRSRGEAARMVLYDYDFLRGGEQLNRFGERSLRKVARLAEKNDFPVIIEPIFGHGNINEARRSNVVSALANHGLSNANQRVIIGGAPVRGLDGIDAEIVHEKLMQTMSAGGSLRYSGGETSANGRLIRSAGVPPIE